MCNSVSFKMSGGVFRNIKKKKTRKKCGKKHYSPSVWSYSPMNRLVKKRTVRAVKKKKKCGWVSFCMFSNWSNYRSEKMPIKNSQNLINPLIRNAGSFLGQKNLSVKWGFPVGRVFMKKKKYNWICVANLYWIIGLIFLHKLKLMDIQINLVKL